MCLRIALLLLLLAPPAPAMQRLCSILLREAETEFEGETVDALWNKALEVRERAVVAAGLDPQRLLAHFRHDHVAVAYSLDVVEFLDLAFPTIGVPQQERYPGPDVALERWLGPLLTRPANSRTVLHIPALGVPPPHGWLVRVLPRLRSAALRANRSYLLYVEPRSEKQ